MYMYGNTYSLFTTESLDGYSPNFVGIMYSRPRSLGPRLTRQVPYSNHSVRLSVCLSFCPSVRLSVRQKTLTLAITFLLLEVSLSYFACVILMTRPFQRYHKFLLLEVSLSYFACVILMTRPFQRYHKF